MSAGVAANPALRDRLDQLRRRRSRARFEHFGERGHVLILRRGPRSVVRGSAGPDPNSRSARAQPCSSAARWPGRVPGPRAAEPPNPADNQQHVQDRGGHRRLEQSVQVRQQGAARVRARATRSSRSIRTKSRSRGSRRMRRSSTSPGRSTWRPSMSPETSGVRVMEDIAKKGIPEVWLNPGADDDDVVARAQGARRERDPGCSIMAIGDSPGAVLSGRRTGRLADTGLADSPVDTQTRRCLYCGSTTARQLSRATSGTPRTSARTINSAHRSRPTHEHLIDNASSLMPPTNEALVSAPARRGGGARESARRSRRRRRRREPPPSSGARRRRAAGRPRAAGRRPHRQARPERSERPERGNRERGDRGDRGERPDAATGAASGRRAAPGRPAAGGSASPGRGRPAPGDRSAPGGRPARRRPASRTARSSAAARA